MPARGQTPCPLKQLKSPPITWGISVKLHQSTRRRKKQKRQIRERANPRYYSSIIALPWGREEKKSPHLVKKKEYKRKNGFVDAFSPCLAQADKELARTADIGPPSPIPRRCYLIASLTAGMTHLGKPQIP